MDNLEKLYSDALQKAKEEARKVIEEGRSIVPTFDEVESSEGFDDTDRFSVIVTIDGTPHEIIWGEDGEAEEYSAWEKAGDYKTLIPFEVLKISWHEDMPEEE